MVDCNMGSGLALMAGADPSQAVRGAAQELCASTVCGPWPYQGWIALTISAFVVF